MTAFECMHDALNLPTSVVIIGIDNMEILDQAFEAVRTFHPMGEARDRCPDGEDVRRGVSGRIRAVQDVFDLRFHRLKPEVARRGARAGDEPDARVANPSTRMRFQDRGKLENDPVIN